MIAERAFDKLRSVYDALDRKLLGLGCVCEACGECCDFAGKDHVLYASRLEIEYMKRSEKELDWSRGFEVCPLLAADGRCGARQHRTLGCRTYFCKGADRAEAQALYEKYLGEIGRVCEQEGIPWEYLRVMRVLPGEGRLKGETA